MPPAKSKAPGFNPPRPNSTSHSKSASKSASKFTSKSVRKSTTVPLSDFSDSEEEPLRPSGAEAGPADLDISPPAIPPDLLKNLLKHHFTDERMRIGGEASALVSKYMETFVREALARAAVEKKEAEKEGMARDFLEVEDLEKLAPQLILDF